MTHYCRPHLSLSERPAVAQRALADVAASAGGRSVMLPFEREKRACERLRIVTSGLKYTKKHNSLQARCLISTLKHKSTISCKLLTWSADLGDVAKGVAAEVQRLSSKAKNRNGLVEPPNFPIPTSPIGRSRETDGRNPLNIISRSPKGGSEKGDPTNQSRKSQFETTCLVT